MSKIIKIIQATKLPNLYIKITQIKKMFIKDDLKFVIIVYHKNFIK